MSDINKRRPEFTTSIRGYDRLQVDDYVERLHNLVTFAEQRARDAESELEFREAESELDLSHHASLGPRVSEILDLAVAESKELRERVKQQADTLFARARREAEGIVESAHVQAAETREQTKRDRKDVLTKLDLERHHARGEILELQRRQTELLGNLRQLQDSLGAAVGMIPDQLDTQSIQIDHDEGTVESLLHRSASTRTDPRIFAPFGGDGGEHEDRLAEERPEPLAPLRVLAR
jgi:cell division septum initiation protein DivIVA